MNISENKRVVMLASLFGLAFVGIMYQGYSAYADADEKNTRLSEIRAEFENYNASEFPPTSNSFEKLRKAYGEANKIKKDLQSKLDRYASAAKSAAQGIKTPVDFQNAVNKAITDAKAMAAEKNVVIGPGAVDLGFGSFKNTAAIATEVPYRAFMLSAVQDVTQILVDAECVAIDKIFCANLPKAADPKARNAPDYFPLRFEVSFTAKRGTLPAVLNSILEDKKYFYLINGLAAESDLSLPSIEDYQEPVTTDIVASDPAAPADQAPAVPLNSVARPMTGLATETVRVHLNLEVLYFNQK